MTDLPVTNVTDKETLHEIYLHIKLTNNGILIDSDNADWNKTKFLRMLKCKLMRHDEMKSLPVCKQQCDILADELLYPIVHSGVYSEYIVRELEEEGMSPRSIVKAIKHGLLSLSSEELKYFQNFEIKNQDTDVWIKKLDDKLIWNLCVAKLTEEQCWNIVEHGLTCQNEAVLCQLLLSGIDIPGILNWPRQDKLVTPTMINFLRELGIDEDSLKYIEEKGIDDEVKNMLIDLGYDEYRQKKSLEEVEEILCECTLIIIETYFPKKKIDECICNCICKLDYLLPNNRDKKSLERNNYLRRNIMIPLSWALSRVLKYCPTDPLYFMDFQLLRWKYHTISQQEMQSAQQYVIFATKMMDQYYWEERINKEIMKNIPCKICLEQQKFLRIKERCWHCTKIFVLRPKNAMI